WALGQGAPETVEANSTDLNNETHPIASIVRYQFPARGEMPPVTVDWYDGLEPPRHPDVEDPRDLGDGEGGCAFHRRVGPAYLRHLRQQPAPAAQGAHGRLYPAAGDHRARSGLPRDGLGARL
ncbi:MAG TPA: hypothetical protein PLC40_16805, partial [Candidatus Hydrogenedentes bacterium]|nr:hypothetical protein [Candidatus Hydrogenedentota bacterium]